MLHRASDSRRGLLCQHVGSPLSMANATVTFPHHNHVVPLHQRTRMPVATATGSGGASATSPRVEKRKAAKKKPESKAPPPKTEAQLVGFRTRKASSTGFLSISSSLYQSILLPRQSPPQISQHVPSALVCLALSDSCVCCNNISCRSKKSLQP